MRNTSCKKQKINNDGDLVNLKEIDFCNVYSYIIESFQITLPLMDTKAIEACRILLDLEYPIILVVQVAHQ